MSALLKSEMIKEQNSMSSTVIISKCVLMLNSDFIVCTPSKLTYFVNNDVAKTGHIPCWGYTEFRFCQLLLDAEA